MDSQEPVAAVGIWGVAGALSHNEFEGLALAAALAWLLGLPLGRYPLRPLQKALIACAAAGAGFPDTPKAYCQHFPTSRQCYRHRIGADVSTPEAGFQNLSSFSSLTFSKTRSMICVFCCLSIRRTWISGGTRSYCSRVISNVVQTWPQAEHFLRLRIVSGSGRLSVTKDLPLLHFWHFTLPPYAIPVPVKSDKAATPAAMTGISQTNGISSSKALSPYLLFGFAASP